ncbi:MAG: CinA family protein [Pseudomonadota bacterium]
MFPDRLTDAARAVLAAAERQGLKLVTAESCTGGLIAACLTSIPGSSAVFERGLVTYSNEAKTELLGVPSTLIVAKGAVSEEVARAMAEGALAHAHADLSVSVTGIAGPDGGSAEKPVGLVHFAAARQGRATLHEEHRFGNIGRHAVQVESAAVALRMLLQLLA